MSEFLYSQACKPPPQGLEIWVEKSGEIAEEERYKEGCSMDRSRGPPTEPKTKFLFKVFFIGTFLLQWMLVSKRLAARLLNSELRGACDLYPAYVDEGHAQTLFTQRC